MEFFQATVWVITFKFPLIFCSEWVWLIWGLFTTCLVRCLRLQLTIILLPWLMCQLFSWLPDCFHCKLPRLQCKVFKFLVLSVPHSKIQRDPVYYHKGVENQQILTFEGLKAINFLQFAAIKKVTNWFLE